MSGAIKLLRLCGLLRGFEISAADGRMGGVRRRAKALITD
jgi:hypothetical protein